MSDSTGTKDSDSDTATKPKHNASMMAEKEIIEKEYCVCSRGPMDGSKVIPEVSN